MKKLNWGMLGTGWIAHEMGEALKRVNGEIYACCATSMESAEKYAEEHPNAKYTFPKIDYVVKVMQQGNVLLRIACHLYVN